MSADIHNRAGVKEFKAGRLRAALEEFKETTRQDPYYAKANFNLSNTYLELHDLDKAEHFGKLAVSCNESDFEALSLLGVVYAKKGQPQRAVDYFREAIRHPPDDVSALAETLAELGTALQAVGNLQEGEEKIREALRLAPKSVFVLCKLGFFLLKQALTLGKVTGLPKAREAEEHLRKACRLDRKHAASWNNLGVAHDLQGHLDDAMKCFNRAHKLEPNDPDYSWNANDTNRRQRTWQTWRETFEAPREPRGQASNRSRKKARGLKPQSTKKVRQAPAWFIARLKSMVGQTVRRSERATPYRIDAISRDDQILTVHNESNESTGHPAKLETGDLHLLFEQIGTRSPQTWFKSQTGRPHGNLLWPMLAIIQEMGSS